jgi:hypothetical protein
VAVHGLRTYDALHLASALAARAATPAGVPFVFVCSDADLAAAARAENLEVFVPEA